LCASNKNESQKISIKNTFYASSNKAFKIKTRQLTRSLILVVTIGYHCLSVAYLLERSVDC